LFFFFFTPYTFGKRIEFIPAPLGLEKGLRYESLDSAKNFKVTFALPYLDLEKEKEGFFSVKSSALAPLVDPGKPELATTGMIFAVPAGFEPRLEILSEVKRTLENTPIKPAQKKFRCPSPEKNSFNFDSALYHSNKKYPSENYVFQTLGSLQGLKLIRLGINPLQMQMGDSKLEVVFQAELKVSLIQTGATTPLQITKPFLELASSLAPNVSDLFPAGVATANPEVLWIVAADGYEKDILPLLEWKRKKGMHVELFSASQLGSTPTAIREALKQIYSHIGIKPSYLLFVGNRDSLPPFMEQTGSGKAATDYPFSLLDGDDFLPDVFYGRILADSSSEVAQQVARFIHYEASPESGTWYPQATTLASNEGSGPSDEDYARQVETSLRSHGYSSVDRLYESDLSANSSSISSALKEGRSWLTYFGHGDGKGWDSTVDLFSTYEVEKLQNANRLPVIIDIACFNASWVYIRNCFGKSWMNQAENGKSYGAIGYYGGSVKISWHEPAVMSVGVAKYHFEKNISSLGASVLAGQIYLMEKMGLGSNTLDNLKWYNLFGDPSLQLRTANPRAYVVSQNRFTESGVVKISISAVDTFGNGLAKVKAALYHSDYSDPVALGETDQKGGIVFTLPALAENLSGVMLTTTGYNLESYSTPLK
jgi:hypothetical protein